MTDTDQHGQDQSGPDQAGLREALKRVAVALKETGVPFALMGGYAAWARGAIEPEHDVDFLVAAQDAERVAELLTGKGFRVEHPPEDWLFKVYTDGEVVDIIFRDSGHAAERSVVESAEDMEVLSVLMPVLPATVVMTQKMNALDEHYCDFEPMLAVARALREQVDWDAVRRDSADNDFAATFLFLLGRLGVIS
jgi:hypothetical protein